MLCATNTPSIRWQCLIWHGVLSDALPASNENPDSGTVPTWSRLPIAAIAKADIRTFTWGNRVDRAEDDVERSVIDKRRLRSILSRYDRWMRERLTLPLGMCTSYVLSVCHSVYACGFDLPNGRDTGVIFDRIIFEITLNLHLSIPKIQKVRA